MLNVPLWGYDDDADALADAIEAANGVFVAQVVSEPGAPGHRFVAAVISRLRTQGFTVVHAVADDATSIRPGGLDAEIEQGQSSTERLAIVVESAHLADSMSLGRLLSRSVGAAKPALLIERQAVAAADLRPFSNITTVATSLESYQEVSLAAPTVDDVADALQIDRAAATALHGAAGGDDLELVTALQQLDASGDTGGPGDLDAFLSRLARDGAPLGGLEDLERRLVELVTVSMGPMSARVLASAASADDRAVLDALERLEREGFVIDTAAGVHHAGDVRSDRIARSMSASRTVAAHRDLATALQEADQPWLEVATHYERAGEWDLAFQAFVAAGEAGAAQGDSGIIAVAADRALRCLDEGATTDPGTRGRLLLTRARDLRFAGYSDQALDDLRLASGLLDGVERVDALGFLAAVLDDHQLPQDADVTIAISEWEATRIGANDKLGSLLSLRARTAARLGFAGEANYTLETLRRTDR